MPTVVAITRIAVAACIPTLFATAQAAAQSITGIGIGAPGQYLSRAVGVSANGQYVTGYTDSATGVQSFRWSEAGGFEFFGSPNSTVPYGISADGTTVVGQGDGQTQSAAFRWSPGGQLSSIGGSGTFATAINATGSVIVGGNNGTFGTATRWLNGSQQGLPGAPYGGSNCTAVNADGSVIAGVYILANGQRAFRWTEGGGFDNLGTLVGGSYSQALGVSGDGATIVGFSNTASGVFAFRWKSETGMQSLGLMAGGTSSQATAISSDGQVTVGLGNTGPQVGSGGAFIHTDRSGMVCLWDYLFEHRVDLTGWTYLLRAAAVSSDGRFVVGNGLFHGEERAFIADLGVRISYPIQWKPENGGNGHWYQVVVSEAAVPWTLADERAEELAGTLGSIQSDAEREFIYQLSLATPGAWSPVGPAPSVSYLGPWLDGQQLAGSPEPGGGWVWSDGSPIDVGFARCSFNNSTGCGVNEDRLTFWLRSGVGAPAVGSPYETSDFPERGYCEPTVGPVKSFVIEWSADCNADGIVDKGQILQGQLVDSDQNGVPDVCEVDPCPGDVTNGGSVDATDLSVILAAWGTNGQGEFDADADNSGLVDGGDLALVLSGWGPCPQ
jgi:probable HAF family extracellular repeat protein